ncbi:hypothetical protein FHW96_004654 [Novosphingobium sp. SG751A]|uniref:glycosyl hydrolase n=1 Tax=Novosphingobium sp. SG751A TaxID=2587000 RepID=UPI0015560A04|nr:glycosyl hydrolase [Novosphingobium sp. SG751A]NOW48466.1 hypothetical protein [Novosphingobium sp. SG751A]
MAKSTPALLGAVAWGALCVTHPAHAQPASSSSVASLQAGFTAPPQDAKPQVWWHLMNGNIDKEGMILDLDWLANVGIGGVHAFSGALFEPTVVQRPLTFMSDGWREAFHAAVDHAKMRGLEVTIAGSPGWSQTGGPWVKPQNGMKKLVWRETTVKGGRLLRLTLPALPNATGPIQALPPKKPSKMASVPIASGIGPVVAYRRTDIAPKAYRLGGKLQPDLASATDDLATRVPITLDGADGVAIDAHYAQAASFHGVKVAMDAPVPFDIWASVDGQTFNHIGTYDVPEGEAPSPQQSVAFAPVRATVMRIILHRPPPAKPLPGVPSLGPKGPMNTALRLLRFSTAPIVDRVESKAGFEPTPAPASTLPETQGIATDQVVDLTHKVAADGTLSWVAPPGDWTILRMGWSLTGQTNAPAEPEATGLEVDKFDADAVRDYIETYLASYEKGTQSPLGPKGISGLLTDSWEAGVQNWTPGLPEAFRRLRGYDPTPWWPVLTGVVVQSREASDNFLSDFRQTLKDLVVSSHYQVLARAAHDHGMTYYTEVQGDLPRAISDGLTAKGQADIPSAEFWFRPFTADAGQPPLVVDLKEAASAAHLYGRKMAAAESLTMAALGDPWSTAPNRLKPVIDRIFATGINRILIHDSHHQPFVDKKPGLQLGIFGQWFNRNESWAGMAGPWVSYLARSSFMLQQGQYSADIAYLYGEEETLTALFNHRFNEAVPDGFAYDYMDAATLKSGLAIRGAQVGTPSGMQYRLLYLGQEARRLGIDYLTGLRDLVRAGAVLVGLPPTGRLGMKGREEDFAAITRELWPEQAPMDHAVGKGRVIATQDLTKATAIMGLAPDVDLPAGSSLMWLHRRMEGANAYYITNQSDTAHQGPLSLRSTMRYAQWWSPETGKITPLPVSSDGMRATVTLDLLPQQAGFVVLTDTPANPVATDRAAQPLPLALDGPWDVRFEANRGAPNHVTLDHLQDLATVADPAIRYFSGEATYSRNVNVPAAMLKAGRLALDLGKVHEVARVTINDRPVGIAWHAPYLVDIGSYLKPGANRIQITVANLWVNRLIGDRQPGAKPIAYAPQSTYRAGSPLAPSGLIGPVVLRPIVPSAFAF